ncbi:MAG: DUF881 domain-containing protein [Clostridiaceae bacterium]|jgi:uncharacterized protein YlxW (UPF0749 family)|nr:DUF881 domain-containing protein [Clostridiaceae bacterium]
MNDKKDARNPSKLSRYVTVVAVGLIVGLVAALLMKTLNASAVSDKSYQDLQNSIIEYQRKNEELNNRNVHLYEYIRELEEDLASGKGGESFLRIVEEKEQYAIFAGLRAVRNKGVTITLTPMSGYKIQDIVIQQFVNELSALGAQAMSINDERKVATTEIRANQDSIIINGVAYSRESPFEIKAIVPPAKIDTYIVPYLETVAGNLRAQIGDDAVAITVRSEPSVTIPALEEDRIAYQKDLLMPVE